MVNSQSSDYSVWRDVAQGARQRNRDAAFFVNMGDLVDNGEDHTQWDAWLSAVVPMIERIPFALVMGNHETYDRNWQVRLPEAYLQEFAVPDNGSEAFRRSPKGPVYILTGVAGDVRYPNLWVDHVLDEAVVPQPETDNYLVLEAKDAQLAVECFLPDGTRIDRVEVVN